MVDCDNTHGNDASDECNECGHLALDALRQCVNCRSTCTPLWRRDTRGRDLCNACGLYLKLHAGATRPSATSRSATDALRQCVNCSATCTPLWRRNAQRRNAQGRDLCNACGLYEKIHHASRPVEKVKKCKHLKDEKCGTATLIRIGPFCFDVQKISLMIAYIKFVFAMLSILWAFLAYIPSHHFNVVMALINLFVALVYLGMIEGVRKRRPMLFLPYLVFTGIDLVIDIVFLICLVVIGIWAPRELVDKWNEMFPQYKMTVEEFRISVLLYSLILAIFFAAAAWCYSVIYRAYNCLKNGLKGSILAIDQ